MKQITVIDLQVILAQLRTATFATLTTITDAPMNKGNNPFYGRVKKQTTINVTLNFIYANSVNNQRIKESQFGEKKAQSDIREEIGLAADVFVPHARKWGERIQGTTLVQHKGGVYVEYKANGKPQSVEYLLDGNKVDKSEVALYLKEANSNKEHQGVEKEIILRDVNINNIKEIVLNKETYSIL
jgi:hypothetical protein